MAKKTVNISVIAACYNCKDFLHDFVKSCAEGRAVPEELIIVDDASTDGSDAILRELSEHYSILKVIQFKENQGVANARNAAIDEAKNPIIAIADSDDILTRGRIKLQYEYFLENPEIDILGSNCIYFSSERKKNLIKSNFPTTHKAILKTFKEGRNGVLNGTVMGRTDLFKKYRFNQESVWAEDYDLYARMIRDGVKMGSLSAPLMKIRIHDASATTNIKRETIRKIFKFRESYFGIEHQSKEVLKEYKHLLAWRKYLISTDPVNRYYYLLSAALIKPEKILRRFRIKR